jgi:NAD(P)-dependent dehydrogenase (short-subunit alcohol dehydrogenase family)
MFFSLQDKNAFITGGASGIGLEIARRLRKAGANVVIADLQDGSAVASEIGGDYLQLDVSSSEQVNAVLAAAVHQLGKLDILINNAGIGGKDGVNIEDSEEALTRKLFEVNTMGVYHGLKHGPQHMNNGGCIINTASLGASMVFPGSGPYSASKAAVSNFTTMAAAELASRQIRVNAVAPSFIRTPMAMDDIELFEKIGQRATNALRIAEPEEVAAVYHFLASDDASYINGQVINVDGGMSIGFTEAMVKMIAEG